MKRRKNNLRKNKAPKPRKFKKQSKYIEDAIAKLIERGNRVVVVRYPVSDEWLELDHKHYPRKKYWDAFARRTDATVIHFKDYETLSGYECPDHSHLDVSDVPKFTLALAAVMEDLGVFETP